MSKEKEAAGKIEAYYAIQTLIKEQEAQVERLNSTKPIFDKDFLDWNEAEMLAIHCREINSEETRLVELKEEKIRIEEDIKKLLPISNRYIMVQTAQDVFKVGCFIRQVSNNITEHDLKIEKVVSQSLLNSA